MDLEFALANHGDTVFSIGDKIVNMGYNSYITLPLGIWMFGLQLGRDYFRNCPGENKYSDSDRSREERFLKTLKNAKSLKRKIPFGSEEDFNVDLKLGDFLGFSDGNFSRVYDLSLRGELLICTENLRRTGEDLGEIFRLDSESAREFLVKYIGYLRNEPRMEIPHNQLLSAIAGLK